LIGVFQRKGKKKKKMNMTEMKTHLEEHHRAKKKKERKNNNNKKKGLQLSSVFKALKKVLDHELNHHTLRTQCHHIILLG